MSVTKKILFIGPHRPNRSPSQRFRMEQYFPYLKKAGFEFDYSWFINEKDDAVFYSQGKWPGKLGLFLKAVRVRLNDVLKKNSYDFIFIQREAFMTGSVFFEKQLSRAKAKLIYDFDDAIWLDDTSLSNQRLKWLKRPGKIADIIHMADEVVAGNNFLAAYARQFNTNTHVIPTVIDTTVFVPIERKYKDKVSIGWSGSLTTKKHFEIIIPALERLKEKFSDKIELIHIGDANMIYGDLQIENIQWNFENEIADLSRIDIGLMPLPDDDWSKGKCGFKALLYMSLAIPPVVSAVGVNTEIVHDGLNGLLAHSLQDWVDKVSTLITSSDLRGKLGREARKTVEKKFSVSSQWPKFISLFV